MIQNQIRNVRAPFLPTSYLLLFPSYSIHIVILFKCHFPPQYKLRFRLAEQNQTSWSFSPTPFDPTTFFRRQAKYQGCMNALANYLILQSNSPTTDKFKATRQREEARKLFGRLEVVDPDRKERYRDMAEGC
jgi:hypothetical protein